MKEKIIYSLLYYRNEQYSELLNNIKCFIKLNDGNNLEKINYYLDKERLDKE